MIIRKKPFQIVNLGKIIITLIFSAITAVAFIFKDMLTENNFLKDLVYNLYDAGLFDAKTHDLISENIGFYIAILFGVITLLLGIRLLYNIIYTKKTEYVFDFDAGSITIEEGIFSKYKDAISLSSIVDIDVTQNFIEMIIKRHTLKIYTKGDLTRPSTKGLSREEKSNINEINQNIEFGYVSLKKFHSIDNPDEVFNKIRSSITVNQ